MGFCITTHMWELAPASAIRDCQRSRVSSSVVMTQDQKRSRINDGLLRSMSMSSSPGVKMSTRSNPQRVDKSRIAPGLKKFMWCGGLTEAEFSYSTRISTPVLLRVVSTSRSPGSITRDAEVSQCIGS